MDIRCSFSGLGEINMGEIKSIQRKQVEKGETTFSNMCYTEL